MERPDSLDSLAVADDSPKASLLMEEFRNSGVGGYCDSQRVAERTRLCIWDHQSPDGKKWDRNFDGEDERAFPWDGASDVRTFTADGVINEQVAMLQMAFWRGMIKVSSVGLEDIGDAAAARTYLEWLKSTKLLGQLDAEVELLAQFTMQNRWAAMHVTWEREIAIKMQPVTMLALQALAQGVAQEQGDGAQNPAEALFAQFPALISNPVMETEAIQVAQMIYRQFAEAELPEELVATDIPVLSVTRARRIVRELRAEGKTEVPMPYMAKNQPCFTALEPWVDIVVPGDVADLQSAPVIFIREWLSEAELLGKALSDGWDDEFIELARATKGASSAWSRDQSHLGDTDIGWEWQPETGRHQSIEILHAYRRSVDDDGVSAVYFTILSPHFTHDQEGNEVVAKHGILNYPHGKYPVVEIRRERLGRGLNRGRGVPELTVTHQNEEKTQRDGLVDFTSIAVVPPMNITKGGMKGKYRFGPAVQNEVASGREPKLLDIPNRGASTALQLLELLRQKLARQFGLIDESVPPAVTQMMQESQVRRFLVAMSEAMQMAWQLCLRFSPEAIQKVTGIRPRAADSVLAIADQHDIMLHYDVAELQPELMAQKLKAFSELLPEDTEGVIDKVKLVVAKARMIDAALADELVTDEGSASQKMFDRVSSDLAQMFLGNQARLSDAATDPTAPARARFAQQLLSSNPRYLAALDPEVATQIFGEGAAESIAQQSGGAQPDPLFSNQIGRYFKNMAMAQKQQENKQIGRVGVQ